MDAYTKIYSLSSSRDLNNVRYIGKTVRSMNDRLYNHIYSSKTNNAHRDRWIRKEMDSGYSVEIKQIDLVATSDWKFWEMFWIYRYRSAGFKLTNSTDGGDSYFVNNNKEVLIVGMDLFILKKFDSVSETSRVFGVRCKNLSKRLNNGPTVCNGNILVFKSLYDLDDKILDKYKVKNKATYIKKDRASVIKSNRKNGLLGSEVSKKPLYVYNNDGELTMTFIGIRSAIESGNGFNKSGICKVLYGKRKYHMGYMFSRVPLS